MNIAKNINDIKYSLAYLMLFVTILFVFIFKHQYYINNDGVLYLSESYKFLNKIDLFVYDWNFYPYLIAVVSKLSQYNTYISAKIIAFCSYIIVLFTLINISKLKKISIVEASTFSILVMIFFHAFLYKYSQYILRDHLFWACTFIFYYLVIYMFLNKKLYEYKLHLLTITIITFGTFMRMEMLILFSYPLIIYFLNYKRSKTQLLKNYNLQIFLFCFIPLVSITLFLIYYPEHKISLSLFELVNKDNYEITTFPPSDNLISLLNNSIILNISIFLFLLFKLLKLLIWPLIFLFFYFFINRKELINCFKKNYQILYLLLPFFLINFITVFVYASNTYITSSRYLISSAIPLLIIFIFLISDLSLFKHKYFKKIFLVSLIFVLTLSIFYKFVVSKNTDYELILHLSEKFPDIEIVSNDPRLEYYAGRQYLTTRPHIVSLRGSQSYLINRHKDKFYDEYNLDFIRNELVFYELPSQYGKYKLYLNLKHFDKLNKLELSE